MSDTKTGNGIKEKGFHHQSVDVFLTFLGDPLRANEDIPDRIQKAHSLKNALEDYLQIIEGDGTDDYWNEVIEEVRLMGQMLCDVWTPAVKSRHPLGGSEH